MSVRSPLCSAALLFSALCLPARRAHAQALTAPNVGTSASGPTSLDPAAVYWNPGMLGMLVDPVLLLGANLLVGDVSYERERRATYQREDSLQFRLPITSSAVDPSKTGKAPAVHATPVAPVTSLFAAMPVGKGFVAGFGLYAPYAAALKFDDPFGAQRFALQQVTIAAFYITPAIAYRINDVVSVGVGASYVFGFAELSKVQDFAATDDVGRALARPPISQANDFGPHAPTGVRELGALARPITLRRAIAHGFTFNAGVAVQPAPALRLGLAYLHSTQMHFNGKVSLDMNDDFFTRDLASQGLKFKPLVEGDATLSFPLPRSVILGASYELTERFGLSAMVDYTFWSQVKSFDVVVRSPDLAQPKLGLPETSTISLPRNWLNTIAVELTGRLKATSALALWLTGGYHSSASPNSTIDVASPDGDRLVGAVGSAYSLSPKFAMLADFKVQAILPRKVTGSDNDLGNGVYNLKIFTLGGYLHFTF